MQPLEKNVCLLRQCKMDCVHDEDKRASKLREAIVKRTSGR